MDDLTIKHLACYVPVAYTLLGTTREVLRYHQRQDYVNTPFCRIRRDSTDPLGDTIMRSLYGTT
jgi:hypothetical protein